MAEPEYLYAVVDTGDEPRVERAQIQYRTPKTVRFADRYRITGYRLVLPKNDVRERGLVATPGAAIAAWRSGAERALKHLEEQATEIRTWLQNPIRGAWEPR